MCRLDSLELPYTLVVDSDMDYSVGTVGKCGGFVIYTLSALSTNSGRGNQLFTDEARQSLYGE